MLPTITDPNNDTMGFSPILQPRGVPKLINSIIRIPFFTSSPIAYE